jgi:Flp pilus assembly protein TadD
MSLIADALKKAQLTKIGRRYRSPDAGGVLPTPKATGSRSSAALFGLTISKVDLSPTLLIGFGSGLVLFVALFAYFFYGRPARVKPTSAPQVAGVDRPTADLILTPPPSVGEVAPFELAPEVAPAKIVDEPAEPSRSPAPTRVAERQKSAETSAPSRAQEKEKKAEVAKVAVTPDLSEEVRHHFNLALFYQEEKNHPMARRAYEKVVQLWPLYVEAHNNLGVVYKELGMYDQAIASLNKAIALNPRYPSAHHNLGVIYHLRGDWKQAMRHYEKVLALDPKHLSSYNNLGLVYRSQKRPHDAREILEKALAINPVMAQTHYNLALVLDEIAEMEAARFHYRRFIDLSGDENNRVVEAVKLRLQELASRK